METKNFDIIVVGAGHAGIEACLAAANLGCKVLVVTTNVQRIGYMSCNPSIGGLAKGHMVREIDILGGQMGIAADKTCIQFKRLNSSKGPAVRGTRVQSDKKLYSLHMAGVIKSHPNITLLEGEVKRLILENNVVKGVVLQDGSEIKAISTIITAGTFMNGVMHIGLQQTAGGRVGDKASVGLSDQLKEFGFNVHRLKTGTPPRLLKQSIDWTKTTVQSGDKEFFPFSLRSSKQLELPQIDCYLTRTSEKTHEIIRNNLDKSPMYCGLIEGTGPRYCPSIEDKVTRFFDKESHHTFLEPEALDSDLIYLQGISTSLPEEIQYEFLRTIPGLENVKMVRPGYAVEYDFVEPTQIFHRLETRPLKNLFLAGQVNGTSGYEEAAAQGFIAGVNAAHLVQNKNEFILERHEAYMGVLIDDLVTRGTREPYRMFTSRAEHRLILREDNTLDRLAERSQNLGILPKEFFTKVGELSAGRNFVRTSLKEIKIYPTPEMQDKIQNLGTPRLTKPLTLEEFLRRPEISFSQLSEVGHSFNEDPTVLEALEIEVKYEGYIRRQVEIIEKTKRLEGMILPLEIDFAAIRGLSTEEVDKLKGVRPRTLGQAQRISGVNPSAIQSILIYLKGHKNTETKIESGRTRVTSPLENS